MVRSISGSPGRRVLKHENKTEIWLRVLADGSQALALYNRGDETTELALNLADLGLTGGWTARDVWADADLGGVASVVSRTLAAHGAVLLRLSRVP